MGLTAREQILTKALEAASKLPGPTDDEIERCAEAIYRSSGGLTDADWLEIFGKGRLQWKTGAPWDTNPDELTEHERDYYRAMARAAVDAYLREKAGL